MFAGVISRLLGLAAPLLEPILIVGVIVLFSSLGVQTLRLHQAQGNLASAREKTEQAQTETLRVKEEWSEQVAAIAVASAASAAAFRQTEDRYRILVQKGQDDVAQLKIKNDAVRADLQSQLAGVRSDLARYAAGYTPGGGGPSADTLAACQHRADTLGSVLAESLRVQEELANDAESESANVRGLLTAWPREVIPPQN